LSEKTFADGGIHCYASNDLVHWHDQGMVLHVEYDNQRSDLAHGCNQDRPKVVYNARTKKFVAYFKLYLKDHGVRTGYVGVAISDSPTGPFRYSHKFLGAGSPNGSGDYAIFQEENGDLYHLTVRKPDKAFVVGKMREDYLMPESEYKVCRGITHATEAPAVVKRDGVYHLLASGSTGWAPNAARYFTSTSLEGPWTDQGNPCEGVNQENGLGPDKTFGGQSTFIIPVEGHQEAYIAMFDIHKPEHPYESGYIWLPVVFANDRLSIKWMSSWNMDFFEKE
jgi:beta-xylosidase